LRGIAIRIIGFSDAGADVTPTLQDTSPKPYGKQQRGHILGHLMGDLQQLTMPTQLQSIGTITHHQ
jgi:hypothetical protein